MGSSSSSQAKNFSQLMAGTDDQAISQAVTDSYDLLYGAWPEEYNQVVLVLDENNSLSTASLYQLGLISAQQYLEIQEQIADGAEVTPLSWDYETICGHTFSLVPASDRYSEKEDGTFAYTADSTPQQEQLVKNGITLTIFGVIRPKTDAANATISTPVAYTSQLTDYVIEHTNASAVMTAQEETPEINVLNGMEFEAPSQEEKIEDAKTYLSSMGVSDKAAMFQMIPYYLAQEQTGVKFSGDPSQLSQGNCSMVSSMGSADEAALAQALDLWLADSPDPDVLLSIYDETIAGASYEENMENFGKVSYDAPSSISIYTDSFEDKESVSQCIADYNKESSEENQITYTDYVELMTQSLTSIVDIISYVLIAFVAVSLVVSCIMDRHHHPHFRHGAHQGDRYSPGHGCFQKEYLPGIQCRNLHHRLPGRSTGGAGLHFAHHPHQRHLAEFAGCILSHRGLARDLRRFLGSAQHSDHHVGRPAPRQKCGKKDPVAALRTE